MNKIYDIFIGRIDGYHTYRAEHCVDQQNIATWLTKGYKIQTEHQIGFRLHEVYLVKNNG